MTNKWRIISLRPAGLAVRCCSVTFTDHRGARHTVEVTAESLYEATALGLRELQACDWVEPIGLGTQLQVEVRQPATRHEITPAQVRRWSESTAASPDERMRKDRVRALLGVGG